MSGYTNPEANQMWRDLGADAVATRIVNAVYRNGLSAQSVDFARHRDILADSPGIGSMALSRIDALASKKKEPTVTSRTFEGYVVPIGDAQIGIPIAVQLIHNLPLAVTMQMFREDGEELPTWVLGIDLLAEGSTSMKAVGQGDVRVRRSLHGDVCVCLDAPEGHAHLVLPGNEVRGFLRDVSQDSRGTEQLDRMIDEAIEAILNG